jgi:hypothetical protein
VALPVLEEYGKSADKQRKGRCKGKYPQRRRSVVCTKLVRKQRLCRCFDRDLLLFCFNFPVQGKKSGLQPLAW